MHCKRQSDIKFTSQYLDIHLLLIGVNRIEQSVEIVVEFMHQPKPCFLNLRVQVTQGESWNPKICPRWYMYVWGTLYAKNAENLPDYPRGLKSSSNQE